MTVFREIKMRNFSQMLAAIKSSENALYDSLVETLGYIHYQYGKGRTKDGQGNEYWPQFINAIQTKWVAERVAKLKPAEKVVYEDAAQASIAVASGVSKILNERKEKNLAASMKRSKAKAERKESERKERVESYEESQAQPQPVVADFVLLAQGNITELTTEEYHAIAAYLAQLRQPVLALAA